MPVIVAYQEGIVYFLMLSDHKTKIGVTSNIEQRLKSHAANGLDIISAMMFICYPARQVEYYFHKKFNDKRVRNEVFDLSFDDWMDAAEEAMDSLSFMGEFCISSARFPEHFKPSTCPKCKVFFFGTRLYDSRRCLYCGSELETNRIIEIT